jgi:hypothetical protein
MSIFRNCQWPVSADAQASDDLLTAFFRDKGGAAVVRSAEGFAPMLWRAWVALQPYELADEANLLERAGSACVVAGECLAAIPVAETLVTHWLLGALGTPAAHELRVRMASAGTLVTLSATPPVSGRLDAVPFGAVAAAVLYLDGDAVRMNSGPPGARGDNIGALPTAVRAVSAADVVLGGGAAAAVAGKRAIAAWRLLVAAQLLGAGRRSLDLAVGYVRERHQFGRPIGSFQAVAHRLADLATELAGAELLIHATAVETGPLTEADPGALLLRADRAVSFAAAAAERAATESLHFHGGYGFTLEHDIQLYLRYIKAWTLQVGGRAAALTRVADAQWPASRGD